MPSLDYHEKIQHRTHDFPLAHYYVDEHFSRYRMTMHWHKEMEIILVRSGRIRFYLDDRELLAEAGDLLTLGSGVIHGGEPENCVYECIVFDPQALTPQMGSLRNELQPLLRNNIFLKNSAIEADSRLRDAARQLFALAQDSFVSRGLEMMGAVFSFLGLQLRSLSSAQLQTVSEHSWQKAEQLKPALEYIEQHYGQRITLDTLARLTGFSPKYFCRYFRTIVHRSPIDYLNCYRVECAANLLATADMNVAETAAHCGFSDSSAFIKQFRKYKGTTPKQYKLRASQGGTLT